MTWRLAPRPQSRGVPCFSAVGGRGLEVVSPPAVQRNRKLFTLLLELRCNSYCTFCGQREVDAGLIAARKRAGLSVPATPFGETRGRYDLASATAAIRKARAEGYDELSLQGGEPTIWPRLPELVREARALGFSFVGLVTNGRRLSDRAFAEALLAAGLNGLSVSLLGADAATHDAISLSPGSFDELCAGLKNVSMLAGGDARPVGVSVTLITTARTLHRLPEQMRLLHELGVGSATIHLVQFDGLAADLRVKIDLSFDARELPGALAAGRAEAERLGIELGAADVPLCLHADLDHRDLKTLASRAAVEAHHFEAAAYQFELYRHPDAAACAGCIFERICPKVGREYLPRGPSGVVIPITPEGVVERARAALRDTDPTSERAVPRVIAWWQALSHLERLVPEGRLSSGHALVREALVDLATLAVQREDAPSLMAVGSALLGVYPNRHPSPVPWFALSAGVPQVASRFGAVRAAGAPPLRLTFGDSRWQLALIGTARSDGTIELERVAPILEPALTREDVALRAFFLGFVCAPFRNARRVRLEQEVLYVDHGEGYQVAWHASRDGALALGAV